MPILYRPARPDELRQTQEHIVRSINDLSERHGFGAMASVRSPDFQLFSWHDDPAGLWTAEQDGEIVGSAFSWVCGKLWFLAELFIAPDRQGQGIGNELLRRTLDQAARENAEYRALITFTFNRVSQGLYIRHGLFPRLPLYMVGGPREVAAARLPEERLRCVRIENTAADLAALAGVDVATLGVAREKHHRFLADEAATQGFLLHVRDVCVGYFYLNAGGHIGPLAAVRSDLIGAAFTSAMHRAAEQASPQVSAFLPGIAEGALKLAMESGLQIRFPMVLVSSQAFGDWTRYLPRNPGFM